MVVDWGACVGTDVKNLFDALFSGWSELRAVETGRRTQPLYAPGCPAGVSGGGGALTTGHGFPTWAPPTGSPPKCHGSWPPAPGGAHTGSVAGSLPPL